MKKATTLIFVCLLVLPGCATKTTIDSMVDASNFAYDPTGGFIPVEPKDAKSQIEVVKNGTIVAVDIRTLSNENLRKKLSNSDQNIAISMVDSEGKLTYLTGSVTLAKGHYVAVMDFSNYIIDDLVDSTGNSLGEAKIGIGLRLIADVHTNKKGLDLGSVFKIGLAASKQELTGRMSIKVIGLTSAEIISLLPGNFSAINETAIQSALEGMAAIKSKIYEADTQVAAKILSVKLNKNVTGDTKDLIPAKI